jgi:hypothetical protein
LAEKGYYHFHLENNELSDFNFNLLAIFMPLTYIFIHGEMALSITEYRIACAGLSLPDRSTLLGKPIVIGRGDVERSSRGPWEPADIN